MIFSQTQLYTNNFRYEEFYLTLDEIGTGNDLMQNVKCSRWIFVFGIQSTWDNVDVQYS